MNNGIFILKNPRSHFAIMLETTQVTECLNRKGRKRTKIEYLALLSIIILFHSRIHLIMLNYT